MEAFFAGAGDPDGGEAIWIAVRQRAQQDGVNDAEHGGRRADAQRQRQSRDSGKSRSFGKRAQREAHDYSYRNAIKGSTFVARRAGMMQAATVTAPSSRAMVQNVIGSKELTS